MFAPPRNFQPRASSSAFWSPVVPQFRDPGRITGNSSGVRRSDFQPLEPTSPLKCTLTKNAPVSPLECTVTKSLNLKCPGMNTYKKRGVGVAALRANQHRTAHRGGLTCLRKRPTVWAKSIERALDVSPQTQRVPACLPALVRIGRAGPARRAGAGGARRLHSLPARLPRQPAGR